MLRPDGSGLGNVIPSRPHAPLPTEYRTPGEWSGLSSRVRGYSVPDRHIRWARISNALYGYGSAVIEIQDLTYEYPTGRALDRVTCTIRRRSVTALVGPNGAGKTTLIRCVVGLSAPFAGVILFDGQDVYHDPRAAHRRMGYLSDFFGVYEDLTARQCLTYMARAYSVPERSIAAAIEHCADRLDILPLLDRPAGELSRGQRQRLAIAQSILHRPDFLVLDEPASGLDPEGRREFSRTLLALRDDGMTILVSSHILAELEDYCSDMLVMRDGMIVGHETLKAGPGRVGRRLRLDLAAPFDNLSQMLSRLDAVSGVKTAPLSAFFEFHGDAAAQSDLLRRLIGDGVPVSALADAPQSLQSAYFAAVKDDGEASR